MSNEDTIMQKPRKESEMDQDKADPHPVRDEAPAPAARDASKDAPEPAPRPITDWASI